MSLVYDFIGKAPNLGIILKKNGNQRNSLLPNHTNFLYDVNDQENR